MNFKFSLPLAALLSLFVSDSSNLSRIYDTQATLSQIRLNQCFHLVTCREIVKHSSVRTCSIKAIVYEIVPPLLTLLRAARAAEVRRAHPSLKLVVLYTKGIRGYEIFMQHGIKETAPAPDCENATWKKSNTTIA